MSLAPLVDLDSGPSLLGSLPNGNTGKHKSWKVMMDLGQDSREAISFYVVHCYLGYWLWLHRQNYMFVSVSDYGTAGTCN